MSGDHWIYLVHPLLITICTGVMLIGSRRALILLTMNFLMGPLSYFLGWAFHSVALMIGGFFYFEFGVPMVAALIFLMKKQGKIGRS